MNCVPRLVLKAKFQKGQTHSDYGKLLPKYSSEPKTYHSNHIENLLKFYPCFNPDCFLGSSHPQAIDLWLCTGLSTVTPCCSGYETEAQARVIKGLHPNTGQEWRKASAWPQDCEKRLHPMTLPKRKLSLSSPQVPGRKFLLWAWLLLSKEKWLGRKQNYGILRGTDNISNSPWKKELRNLINDTYWGHD